MSDIDKEKLKKYDEVVNTIITNVLIEHHRLGKFVLYNFNPDDPTHQLYFNVTAVAADLQMEPIYLEMPFLSYVKLWIKFRKKRKNIRWLSLKVQQEIGTIDIIEVQEMMDFICKEMSIKEELFEEINDEYYGWSLN